MCVYMCVCLCVCVDVGMCAMRACVSTFFCVFTDPPTSLLLCRCKDWLKVKLLTHFTISLLVDMRFVMKGQVNMVTSMKYSCFKSLRFLSSLL